MTSDPVNRVRYTFEEEGDDLVVHCWLAPGGALPAHLHPRQTEVWSAVNGEVGLRLGDEWRTIGPDDGEVVVPPGVVHALRSASEREVRLRAVASPALDLRRFLEESAAAARDRMFTAGGLPRGLRGARWAARFLERYGDQTVFLEPPRIVQRALIALLAR